MLSTSTTIVPPPGPQVGAVAPVPPVRGVQSAADGSTATNAQSPDPSAATQAPPPTAPAAASASQLKLVVAKSDTSIAYSYTLVDQVTGRVVAQIPHEAAEAAAANPDYTAGGVVDTTA